MGIRRFAGAFAVAQRQSECGSKTAGMHVSQPVTHRRVLAAGRSVVIKSSFISVVLIFCLSVQ